MDVTRKTIAVRGVDFVLASMLDGACRLRSIRVADVDQYSVALSYALIGVDNAVLYVNTETVDLEVREDVAGRGCGLRATMMLCPICGRWRRREGWVKGSNLGEGLRRFGKRLETPLGGGRRRSRSSIR